MTGNFVDDRHALFVGWTLGIAMRNGIVAQPIADEDGNATDRLLIRLPDGMNLTVVVPYPPEGWVFEEWGVDGER